MDELSVLSVAIVTSLDVINIGGTENSVMRIAYGLSCVPRMEIHIIVLAPDHVIPFNQTGDNGVEIRLSPIDGVRIYKIGIYDSQLGDADKWRSVHSTFVELVNKNKYNIIHAFHASFTGFPAVYAAKLCNIPSVVSIRGGDINRDSFHNERFSQLVWALHNANEITSVSHEGLNKARVLIGEPLKGRVILNSIRPDEFQDGVQDINLTKPIIGSLGNFRTGKGLEVLLSAFKSISVAYDKASLLMIGDVVSYDKDKFMYLAKKYQIEDRITITGEVDRVTVLRYLRALDVFVYPSLHDGCPNAVLEAMLAGVPIVASRCGAIPELIEDGKDGLLVSPNSAIDLVRALTKMINGNRSTFSKNAKSRVLSEFNISTEITSYINVYQSIRHHHR